MNESRSPKGRKRASTHETVDEISLCVRSREGGGGGSRWRWWCVVWCRTGARQRRIRWLHQQNLWHTSTLCKTNAGPFPLSLVHLLCSLLNGVDQITADETNFESNFPSCVQQKHSTMPRCSATTHILWRHAVLSLLHLIQHVVNSER